MITSYHFCADFHADQLHTEIYNQVFHNFTLKLHVILSSLRTSILKPYQMRPKQADNKEAKFLDWQTFYLNLLKAKCYVSRVSRGI
jgi:hypothetical protein